MKIGILGSGDVGKTLATAFKTEGHDVMIGSRDKSKIKEFCEEQEIKSGDFKETAMFGELVVFAAKGEAIPSVVELADEKSFSEKIVIDTTNPLNFSTMPPKLLAIKEGSSGEQLQALLPSAKVVKAFNMIGAPHMYKPDFPDGPPTMIIAGNDSIAKHNVSEILQVFGWDVMDAGDITCCHYIECVAMLWVDKYFTTQNGNHAFKLLQK